MATCYAIIEIPASAGTSGQLDVVSATIDTHLNQMGQATCTVSRQAWDAANATVDDDYLTLYNDNDVQVFGGPLRDARRKGETVQLTANTYEQLALDAPPAPPNETYTQTTDKAVVEDAIDAIDGLSADTVEQVQDGTFDITFHHASQALKIRDMRDLSGAEIEYTPRGTVRYRDRVGIFKGVELSPSEQRVQRMRVTHRAGQRTATHLKVIGYNVSVEVTAASYSSSERERWRRAVYPAITDKTTLSSIGQRLVDELYEPWTEIEADIINVSYLHVGDTYPILYPEENIDDTYRITKLSHSFGIDGETFTATFSDRVLSSDEGAGPTARSGTEVGQKEENEVIARPAARELSLPYTELTDGDFYSGGVPVPDEYALTVDAWGARTTDDTTPAGLTVQLLDETGTVVASENTVWNDDGNLATKTNDSGGTVWYELAVDNATGTDYLAAGDDGVTAQFRYRVG